MLYSSADLVAEAVTKLKCKSNEMLVRFSDGLCFQEELGKQTCRQKVGVNALNKFASKMQEKVSSLQNENILP